MSKILQGLNESQTQAVTSSQGPCMILAGAGSGKTRTLVARIVYLLEELRVSPFQILAVTFSNKAAREMRERIASEVGTESQSIKVTTFHSFCANLLRSEGQYLGLGRHFTIYDESESKSIASAILAKRGLTPKEFSPYTLLYYIDELKNKGFYQGRKSLLPKSLAHYEINQDEELYSYYLEYESELAKSNAVDFGGLITGALKLFETYPQVLEHYQQRFKYVLVDEYQDTNRAQFDLVYLLSQKHSNICVVGDEDQSIYSWRGADIRNILDFEKVFPNSQTIKLEQNYRSSKTIIDAATCVIARNEMRKGKNMWTDNASGDAIEIVECINDKAEADFCAREIAKLKKESASPYKDMAIFYRSNAQSRMIEDALRRYQIPYRVLGGIKFYDRKEIKDMLSYLRLITNPKDSLALSRIINTPARGIGATTLRKLEDEALRLNLSLYEIIDALFGGTNPQIDLEGLRLGAKIKSALKELFSLLHEVALMNGQGASPSALYEKLLHESGYLASIKAQKDYESQARIENLEELLSAIKQYEQSAGPKPAISGFLETITLDSQNIEDEEDPTKEHSGEISLMTVHSAKGLEFPYVFVVGVEEQMFPSYKSLENGPVAIEEERRLFYVAMTRAMKKLHICFAQARMLFGSLKFNGPSRFVQEIPEQYFEWKRFGGQESLGAATGWARGGQEREYDEYSQEYVGNFGGETIHVRHQTKNLIKSTYPQGSRVHHTLYGEALVMESEGSGADEKVLLRFKDGTKKRFMVKFAPLVLL